MSWGKTLAGKDRLALKSNLAADTNIPAGVTMLISRTLDGLAPLAEGEFYLITTSGHIDSSNGQGHGGAGDAKYSIGRIKPLAE